MFDLVSKNGIKKINKFGGRKLMDPLDRNEQFLENVKHIQFNTLS